MKLVKMIEACTSVLHVEFDTVFDVIRIERNGVPCGVFELGFTPNVNGVGNRLNLADGVKTQYIANPHGDASVLVMDTPTGVFIYEIPCE